MLELILIIYVGINVHDKDHSFLRKAPMRDETGEVHLAKHFIYPSNSAILCSVGRQTTEHAEVGGEAASRFPV